MKFYRLHVFFSDAVVLALEGRVEHDRCFDGRHSTSLLIKMKIWLMTFLDKISKFPFEITIPD
jgi:hypothetical protein